MANFLAEGNKTVMCKCGKMNIMPFQKTIFKCAHCGMTACVFFRGVVIDKHGNYVY
jgi:hypothetical protein